MKGHALPVTSGTRETANPPGLGPGHTRFDSEVPDYREEPPERVAERGLRPSASLSFTWGCSSGWRERRIENPEVGGSKPPGPTM